MNSKKYTVAFTTKQLATADEVLAWALRQIDVLLMVQECDEIREPMERELQKLEDLRTHLAVKAKDRP